MKDSLMNKHIKEEPRSPQESRTQSEMISSLREESVNDKGNCLTASISAKKLLLKSKIFRVKIINSPERLLKMQGKLVYNGEEKTVREIYELILPSNNLSRINLFK